MSSTKTHAYKGLEEPDTNNSTWFDPEEKSINENWKPDDWWNTSSGFRFQKKSVWWTYLEQLNQGVRNGKHTNGPYWTYRDNVDLIHNVSDQIGTTAVQSERAKKTYFHVHDRDRIDGTRKDATAVAVVAYIIEYDDNDERRFEPQWEFDNGETVADSLSERFNIDARLITSTYGKVRHHLRLTDSLGTLPTFDSEKLDRRGLFVEPDFDDPEQRIKP